MLRFLTNQFVCQSNHFLSHSLTFKLQLKNDERNREHTRTLDHVCRVEKRVSLVPLNLLIDTIEYTGDEAFNGRDSIEIVVVSPHRNLDGTVSTSQTSSSIQLDVIAARPRLEGGDDKVVHF